MAWSDGLSGWNERIDPGRSACVLIGVDAYAELPPLPEVRNNLVGLKAALTDRQIWGVPEERCQVVVNPTTPQELVDAVFDAAQTAEDTLLIYHAGHGIEVDGSLYLALRNTRPPYELTAVAYERVRDAVSRSRVSRCIVILDYCSSGRAVAAVTDVRSPAAPPTHVDGYHMLTTTYTRLPQGERHTVLTGELLRVLTEGIPDGPEFLTLDSISHTIRTSLEERGMPRPASESYGIGSLSFARNRGHRQIPEPDPAATNTAMARPMPPGQGERLTAPPGRDRLGWNSLLRQWPIGMVLFGVLLPPAHGWWWPAALTAAWTIATGWGIAVARRATSPADRPAEALLQPSNALFSEPAPRRWRAAFREGFFSLLIFASPPASRRALSPSRHELLHAAYVRLGPPPTTSAGGPDDE